MVWEVTRRVSSVSCNEHVVRVVHRFGPQKRANWQLGKIRAVDRGSRLPHRELAQDFRGRAAVGALADSAADHDHLVCVIGVCVHEHDRVAMAADGAGFCRCCMVDHRSVPVALRPNTPSDADMLSLRTEAVGGTARLRVPGGGVLSLVADVDSLGRLARYLIRALFTASIRQKTGRTLGRWR